MGQMLSMSKHKYLNHAHLVNSAPTLIITNLKILQISVEALRRYFCVFCDIHLHLHLYGDEIALQSSLNH